nr:class II aldolase/adducin family protein [uncultured Celeribacter sp.]
MTQDNSFSQLREAVAKAARTVADHGLVGGTSGNVSARQGDVVAVTATGVVLANTTAEEVTVVDMDGTLVAGDLAPTSELDLHLGVYRSATCGAVVHCHAPYATAAGCVLSELPVIHYEQIALGGSVRVAPFAVFGTAELAENVKQALKGRKAALMANHGAVAHGKDLEAAVSHALLLEWLCRLHATALSFGTPRALTVDEQVAVIEHAVKVSYGSTRKT